MKYAIWGSDLAQIFYPDIMIVNLDEIVRKLEIADVLIMIHIYDKRKHI
jgi:hypothetical protein